jgi:putative ATP-dependent endonuclease of OLD family
MERTRPPEQYTHFDLAGVSLFAASGDGDVPRHGPIFAALGKLAFGFYDKPGAPLSPDALAKLTRFTKHWESPERGIENLLVKGVPIAVIKRFLADVTDRNDYPANAGAYTAAASDADMATLATKVLKARKGEAHSYAAILVSHCQNADELPATVRSILEEIHRALCGGEEGNGGAAKQLGLV